MMMNPRISVDFSLIFPEAVCLFPLVIRTFPDSRNRLGFHLVVLNFPTGIMIQLRHSNKKPHLWWFWVVHGGFCLPQVVEMTVEIMAPGKTSDCWGMRCPRSYMRVGTGAGWQLGLWGGVPQESPWGTNINIHICIYIYKYVIYILIYSKQYDIPWGTTYIQK